MSAGVAVQMVLTAAGAVLASSTVAELGSHSASQSSVALEYQAFRSKFRNSADDSVSFDTRLRLFQVSKAKADAHNARPDKLWVATADNKFADYTDHEWTALFGYKRHAAWEPAGGGLNVGSFLEIRGFSSAVADEASVLESVDWRGRLNESLSEFFIRSQGSCGSCWAVAAAGALEALMERSGMKPVLLSYEQLVDCTPNPQHCGGEGACTGATGELAFEQATKVGIVPANMYRGYQTGGDKNCHLGANHEKNFQIEGFHRLRTNKLSDMLHALSTTGPAVVSVDATGWGMYESGVFDGCKKDATINHAVLAVGYGHDTKLRRKYWLIRNSWSGSWGEGGYIRLLRHSSDTGDAGWCGTDHKPKEGTGCDGGPETMSVCGMCGVLSDTSYPYGIKEMKLTDSQMAGLAEHGFLERGHEAAL